MRQHKSLCEIQVYGVKDIAQNLHRSRYPGAQDVLGMVRVMDPSDASRLSRQ